MSAKRESHGYLARVPAAVDLACAAAPVRIWDRFLTEQDRAHLALQPSSPKGAGSRPVLLLVDLYRWVFGDKREELLDTLSSWPGSCGTAGWDALPHIQRLLVEARKLRIPIMHVTGLDGLPSWRDAMPGDTAPEDDEAALDRRRRRFDIVDEVAPIDGEVVLRKAAPSAFWGTPLAGLLNGADIDTIIVAGESTSGCVRATVVEGKSYRFKVIVPEECVFDRHEVAHAINLFDMDQKYADVIGLDNTLDYLKRCSAHNLAKEAQ